MALTEALENVDDEGKEEEIGQTDMEETPTLSLQQQQQEQQSKDALPPTLTTLKPLPMKDLPRANFSFTSAAKNMSHDNHDSDDDISVFTEVTIEEIVQSVAPSSDAGSSGNAFKDQMRNSFLAFEQLVHAKHQIDDDEYDEETVFEEYSIVHDDSKTVMTEMTTEELIESVVIRSRSTNDNAVVGTTTTTPAEAPQDSLENFHTEMRKSFAAFEALLGDDEFDEPETKDDGESCEESFDEFTVEESIAATNGPRQQDDDTGYDDVTVAESIIAELAGVVHVDKPAKSTTQSSGRVETADKEQRKEEKIRQFQNEMKKSFTAFESLILKKSEKEEEDDDADSCVSDEYTVEEIVDQVTAGDDSKLFAKEMQKSFLAFESLLKHSNNDLSKEEESVWDEETVQETVQGSAAEHPPTPRIVAYNAPSAAATPLSPNRSVGSSKASEQSGRTYEDAISLVGGEGSNRSSGANVDDAIMVLDADEEKSRIQPDKSYEESGEEKKDGESLLQNTQQFLNAIGGMVSFDKGGSTEDTEQETLSGHMRPDNAEKKEGAKASSDRPSSLSKSPTKKKQGPVLILTNPGPTTGSPAKKFTHQPDLPLDINLTNSRMFSETGLVLPSSEKKSKAKTPQKNLPVMDVEFNHGTYEDDDDDMTQITFDHTIHETPQKQRPPPKEDEGSPGQDDAGSTCSSQASKGIADMLRKDIWSPDLKIVQSALEKLGIEAVKGRSYRSHIVKFGGLLGILRAMDMNPTHSGIQLAACQALERLALDPETQMSIGGVGGIPVVATSMQNNAGSVEMQRAATAALVNISCCPQDNIEGVLQSVISSMTRHSNDTEVQENSFKVLANLTMDSPERLKELSHRGGLAAMTMALQKPWSIKAEHHEAISLLSMLLRNLAECNQ
ncbi:unnamed protein product [Cylindrotheca closterium]|uniref:Vacuolar protein 8 n=1 Tax=Cylindrotheca closterium TaxID=2856 RepID=A0AAD2GAG8_9STRA|nr:unnamed protein product [Cylindrotheca closterium]